MKIDTLKQEINLRYHIEIKRRTIYVNGCATKDLGGESGGYRLIGETPDGKIVKADFTKQDGDYTNQTWAEIEMWNRIKKYDKRYFPTIIASGTFSYNKTFFSWLLQEKVEFGDVKTTKRQADIVRRLRQAYKIWDISTPRVGKRCSSYANWNITPNGKPVIYDFGFNRFGNSGILPATYKLAC